jgi:DNA-binding CsgD family transcriptional regulator
MKEIYSLTEAEADVLQLLVAGHDSEAMAEMRQASVETVRTQIKRVLAKTDTHGRPALVRLALSVNPPVDPAPVKWPLGNLAYPIWVMTKELGPL